MSKLVLEVNGVRHETDAPPSTPLLWFLRDTLGLTGTKYGCGEGSCGACTVLEEGVAVRACQVDLAAAAGRRYTTIEGLSTGASHPIQRAWLEENVAQCGYCQPGQIMAATALLESNRRPSDADINAAMDAILCRCATYVRIRAAIHAAAEALA